VNENINIEHVQEIPREQWGPFEDDGSYSGARNVELISVFVKNHTNRFVIKQGITVKTNSEIPFIDIRVWFLHEETGQWKPGRQGVRMTPAQWCLFQSILNDNRLILAMDLPDAEVTNHTGYHDTEVTDAINRNAVRQTPIVVIQGDA
jgi:hypothetical protein